MLEGGDYDAVLLLLLYAIGVREHFYPIVLSPGLFSEQRETKKLRISAKFEEGHREQGEAKSLGFNKGGESERAGHPRIPVGCHLCTPFSHACGSASATMRQEFQIEGGARVYPARVYTSPYTYGAFVFFLGLKVLTEDLLSLSLSSPPGMMLG